MGNGAPSEGTRAPEDAAERRQLVILPELDVHVRRDELVDMLRRGGLRDSSIRRYLSEARAWVQYCRERGEPYHDASTSTLLRWLDGRVRRSKSPACALRMSLAAVRFAQRAWCVVHEVEAVPYAGSARVQLDAYVRTATMDRSVPTRATPLRLDALMTLVQRVRGEVRVRRGVHWDRAVMLAERDACALVLGWWGALRADDLARLAWEHVREVAHGVELHLHDSKTGWAVLALAAQPAAPSVCPVVALARYRRELAHCGYPAAGSLTGYQCGDHVGRRLTHVFVRHGVPRGYTAHSLRAGFASEAASQGVPDKLVQAHGRWRSSEQHGTYVRLGRLWADTPTTRLVVPHGSEVV